jgi:hypothetical protein
MLVQRSLLAFQCFMTGDAGKAIEKKIGFEIVRRNLSFLISVCAATFFFASSMLRWKFQSKRFHVKPFFGGDHVTIEKRKEKLNDPF